MKKTHEGHDRARAGSAGSRLVGRIRSAALDVICQIPPAVSMRAAAHVGRWLAPVSSDGRAFAALSAELSAALPADRQFDAARVARELASRRMMDRLLSRRVRQQGIPAARAVVDVAAVRDMDALRVVTGPRVVVTWHVGPPFGLIAAFAKAEFPAMGVLRSDYGWRAPHARFVFTGGGDGARMSALWQATQHLKDGGVVVIAADGLEGERTAPVTCLGRRMPFGRGPFVLARLGQAAVVPMVSRWKDGGHIGVVVGSPLDVDRSPAMTDLDYEHALAEASARWFERFVLGHLAQLRPHTLRWLCSYPRAAG